MRKVKRTFSLKPQTLLAVCFFAGIITGTLFTNLMHEEIEPQFGYLSQLFLTATVPKAQTGKNLFLMVLRQRLLETTAGWLIGLTALSVWGFSAILFYYGFSTAVILSVTTMQKGIMGIFVYLVTMLPQWLVYLPVMAVLLLWAVGEVKKTRPAGLLVLLAATGAGAVAEVYLNPMLMRILPF